MRRKILITPDYRTQDYSRNTELDFVLHKNILLNIFDKIILFCDYECFPTLSDERIEIIEVTKRPTYLDFFTKGNEYSNDIVIVANSDIFFDETINLSDKFIKNRKNVLALTRYEYVRSGDYYSDIMIMGCDSQDSWIYLSPLNIIDMDIDFGLGIPGCDNRVAYELSKKYEVKNPSYSIKTYHLHESGFRTYDPNNRLDGEYLQVHIE